MSYLCPGEVAEWSSKGVPSGECSGLGFSYKMYFAYILISLKDGRYYYGCTADLEKRFKDHSAGRVKSTKGRRPFQVHYFEQFNTRSEAAKREAFFKSIEGYRFLKAEGII